MSGIEIYIAIAIMAVVNFITRVFPFLFFRKNELPPYIVFIEKFFPAVIMTILIVYSVKDVDFSLAPYGLKEIGGIVFTAVLHLTFEKLSYLYFCRNDILYGFSAVLLALKFIPLFSPNLFLYFHITKTKGR